MRVGDAVEDGANEGGLNRNYVSSSEKSLRETGHELWLREREEGGEGGVGMY